MKTAEMNALKCLVFTVFFFHQWMHEKKVPVTTNGGGGHYLRPRSSLSGKEDLKQ